MQTQPERSLGGRPPRTSRTAVVGAGLEILELQGLQAVTLAAVAQRLGLGKPAIYTYIRNKEDLLRAMRDEINRRQLEALRSDAQLPPEEALRALCGRLVKVVQDYGPLLSSVDPDQEGLGLQVSEHFLAVLARLGLDAAAQLKVYVLLAGFLRSFPGESGGVRRADASVQRAVADSEGSFPQLANVLDHATAAGGWNLVEEVLTMVIDVLIPALRSA